MRNFLIIFAILALTPSLAFGGEAKNIYRGDDGGWVSFAMSLPLGTYNQVSIRRTSDKFKHSFLWGAVEFRKPDFVTSTSMSNIDADSASRGLAPWFPGIQYRQKVITMRLAPGSYIISKFSLETPLCSYNGIFSINCIKNADQSIHFTVVGGEVKYLGQFEWIPITVAEPTMGARRPIAAWYMIVTDQVARDSETIKKAVGAELPITTEIANPGPDPNWVNTGY